jgi:hypothetical protein
MDEEKIVIDDNDELLRLLFSSEHFDNGIIKDQGIPTQDLQKRGYSLDLKKIASKAVLEQRASTQSSKAKSPEDRKDAYISYLLKGDAIQATDPDGTSLFKVLHSPIDDNPAHTSLLCIESEQTKSYYVMARNKLRPLLLRKIISIKDFLS